MKVNAIFVLGLFLLFAAGAAAQEPSASNDPDPSRDPDGSEPHNGNETEEGKDGQRHEREKDNSTHRDPSDPEPSEPEPKESESKDREPNDASPKDPEPCSSANCKQDARTQAFVNCVGGNGYAQAALADDEKDISKSGLYELQRLREVAVCCEKVEPSHAKARQFCQELAKHLQEWGKAKHVELHAIKGDLGFEGMTVDGRLVIERFAYTPEDDGEAHAERKAGRIAVRFGDEARLIVYDNPTGLLQLKGDGSSNLRFPEGTLLREGRGGLTVQGQGWSGFLRAKDVAFDGRTVEVDGAFSFQLLPKDTLSIKRLDGAVEKAVEEAVEKGYTGAVVNMRKSSDAQVLAYDEVDINVELPDVATQATPIRVEFDAKLTEGRTFILDVDAALLQGADADQLDLRYYDVVYTNGTRHEVEVSFAAAASLGDIMDPTDDGIQPEFWVVQDQDGTHVMVSIPTWSIHAITIASIVEFVTQPSVLVGAMAGAVGSLVAAVLLLTPRRPETD